MKRENRRRGKSRKDDNWFVVNNRKAQWLSWFERYAMHKNAGLAEARYDPVREIAGTL